MAVNDNDDRSRKTQEVYKGNLASMSFHSESLSLDRLLANGVNILSFGLILLRSLQTCLVRDDIYPALSRSSRPNLGGN